MNFIVINLRQEGVHRWKTCPFEEVAFLCDYHRHEFHFIIELEVFHEDREVEIIMLKRQLQLSIKNLLENPVDLSCEAMAEYTMSSILQLTSKDRYCKVTVLEDGENGGGTTNEYLVF